MKFDRLAGRLNVVRAARHSFSLQLSAFNFQPSTFSLQLSAAPLAPEPNFLTDALGARKVGRQSEAIQFPFLLLFVLLMQVKSYVSSASHFFAVTRHDAVIKLSTKLSIINREL
jgi:hypothetical protein